MLSAHIVDDSSWAGFSRQLYIVVVPNCLLKYEMMNTPEVYKNEHENNLQIFLQMTIQTM